MVYRIRTVCCFALLVFTAVRVFAATEERKIHQTFGLDPRGTIELGNVHGDVTIQAWDKNEVDLKATKRGKAEYLDLVEIEIDATPQRLSIETKYPRKKNDKDRNVSVTYELMVPRHAVLDSITTVNGGIDVSGVEGEMRINTVNGSADVSGSKAPVHATTVNGNITVKWSEFPQAGAVKMQTVNGSLEVQIPGNSNAKVYASSLNGSIQTDFPITVQGFVSRKLEGQIGSGGPTMDLSTINGGIEIVKMQ